MDHVRFSGTELRTLPGLVMTPRPTTEAVVAAALARIGDAPARVADVGTGSGAIAIALARQAPVDVWATDTCAWSVILARLNARDAGVGERVHVLEGDLLAPVPGELDLVVANLPYLPFADRALYPDLAGEPLTAVFAEGDGLDPYRGLLAQAEPRLRPGGAVVFQLHREVYVTEREELAAMRAHLDALTPALAA
jgi:release factor glutamine methyltransferase